MTRRIGGLIAASTLPPPEAEAPEIAPEPPAAPVLPPPPPPAPVGPPTVGMLIIWPDGTLGSVAHASWVEPGEVYALVAADQHGVIGAHHRLIQTDDVELLRLADGTVAARYLGLR